MNAKKGELLAPGCDRCGAGMVVCTACGAAWCLDHQVNPLVCPGCGDRPSAHLQPFRPFGEDEDAG